jgi:hypothetical protein
MLYFRARIYMSQAKWWDFSEELTTNTQRDGSELERNTFSPSS